MIKDEGEKAEDLRQYKAYLEAAGAGYNLEKGITARSKISSLVMKPKRMLFAAMEPYFNLAFEAFMLQTNGKEKMPTVTELAALYFDVDEVTAAAYLLGSARGGEDCRLD